MAKSGKSKSEKKSPPAASAEVLPELELGTDLDIPLGELDEDEPQIELVQEDDGDAPTKEMRLPDLQAELQNAEDRVLRAQAELENFRRRMRREMENERQYAALPLLNDLMTVVDNLGRAIGAAEQSEGQVGLLDGVKMVTSQLMGALEKHHCTEIQADGQPFDPNLHEAIAQQPSDEYAAGIVMMTTQAGFQLNDRVVRPSQVIVSTGPVVEGESSK